MRAVRTFIRVAAFVITCATGCGEGDPQPLDPLAFQAFFEARNGCTADTDCVLAGESCITPCGVAVNAKFAKEVEAEAKKSDLSPGGDVGRHCFWHCGETQVICQADRCEEGIVE
jgi:hypothetical protein